MESRIDAGKLLFLGVCALFFFIPVSIVPLSITEGLTVLLWLVSGKFIKTVRFLKNWKLVLPLVAMVILPWAGLLYTSSVSAGWKFVERTDYWLFAFIAAYVISSGYKTEYFLKSYIAGVSLTSVMFLLQLAGIVPRHDQYSAGFFGTWAHIKLSLLITFSIVLLSFYFSRASREKDRLLCAALMLVQFAALVLMLSDSGQLAFILLTPVIAYNLPRKKSLKKALAGSVLIIAVMFLSPVMQSRLKEAVHETDVYGKGQIVTPLGIRYYMWEGAVRIFREHPVIGAGTGGYEDLMNKSRPSPDIPDVVHPHNTLLFMASSYGVIGVLVLIWLWAVPLKAGWQGRHSLAGFAILVYMAVLTVGSITDTQIMSHQTGVLFAMLYGVAIAGRETGPAAPLRAAA